jgi:DNA processing protein
LWLYGNVRLLDSRLAYIEAAGYRSNHRPAELDEIEQATERLVLDGQVLVAGIHSPAHQRSAVVPLRWGSPRILVLSGGFQYHLGPNLQDEPFRAARLWRYQFDPHTDLVVSRRAPDRLPTYALINPTVDRLVKAIALRHIKGELFAERVRTA